MNPSQQHLHHDIISPQSSTLEKSPMSSFFKRPIRMMRDKKAPPAPLIVNPDHPANSSSSHTGTKFNSLLTAAARSIRTGDSRLFESFQAALSPKPIQSNFSPPNPPPPPKNFNSLKRIPVPSYSPLQIQPAPPKPDSLTRATSLERPRTAPKHSRTTSLPYSQAAPTLELRPASILKTQSHQDLAESLEKLSGPEQQLAQLFDRQPHSSPIQSQSTLHLQSVYQISQNKSSPQISSPFDSTLFSLDFCTHPHSQFQSTPTSAHRTGSNISFDHSRDIVTKSLGTHHASPSPSMPSLPQLGSQISLPVPPRVPSSQQPSSLCSSIGSNRASSARLTDFLEPNKKSLSAREAQRRSFQNMPLPALPPPCSPQKRTQPPSRPFLELPPDLNPGNEPFPIAKKSQRPWSIANPGSYDSLESDKSKSFSRDEISFDRLDLQISGNHNSPLKVSALGRQNRHSYPSQSVSNLSPLERVSDNLKSAYSTSQTDHKSPVLKLPTFDRDSIGQRENEALRLTPSITPPCGNLMFGFRGEVFELDKYQKTVALDQSIKVLIDSDSPGPKIPSSQLSPRPKLSQLLINETLKTGHVVEHQDVSLSRSLPASSKSLGGRPTISRKPVSYPIPQPKVLPDLPKKAQPELEELGEFIELKEICLIGSDHLDHTQDHNGSTSGYLNPVEESIAIEPYSPRNSEKNCSTEVALESLSVDRGSSEEESSRLLEESMKFESGPEPKIINPDTSLEMAASILGQPVPPISKEIREGFDRIHYLFSDGRSKESVGKDKLEFMAKMLKSIDHKFGQGIKTSDASTQTDPVEFITPRSNHNTSIFQPSPMIMPKLNNRRITDTLKKLASRNELSDHFKENLPFNLTRHSVQSEQSFVSANRSYGGVGPEDQQESLRTSGGLVRSPRSDYTTDRPSLRKQRLSDMSDSNPRFSSTWTTHSIHTPQQYCQNSPLRKNTGESHLGLQINSSALNDSVLEALDKALRAEESFQREKQHLQSVARRQSQTIEALLVDKEVLTLEVSRLTGLVELLARDHNLLNERIDKAEKSFGKFPTSSNRTSVYLSQNPDDTINYFTATGERMMVLKEDSGERSDDTWMKKQRRKRRNGGNLTETDDGIMAGDSEDWDDGNEEDGESLCDPEQSSIHIDHHHLSFEFVVETSKDNLDPLPGSYPLLAPPNPHTLSNKLK